MKKFLVILLIALLGLSCFACVDDEQLPNCNLSFLYAYDTMIQDSNGVDQCFWEDGGLYWDNFEGSDRQDQKSALLTTQTEYDMWFALDGLVLELSNEDFYYPTEFEYDETKIEIKANPDKENHFILKILQTCDNEEITSKLSPHRASDYDVLENGEAILPSVYDITITVSTTE